MERIPLLTKLNKNHLNKVANNFAISVHAAKRLNERYNHDVNGDIKEAIKNSPFAYVANDSSISVGTKDKDIFKFIQPDEKHNTFLMVTYYEPSINNVSIKEKFRLTLRGHNR